VCVCVCVGCVCVCVWCVWCVCFLQERESLLFVTGSILTIKSLAATVYTTSFNIKKTGTLLINIILMRAHVTIFATENIKYYIF